MYFRAKSGIKWLFTEDVEVNSLPGAFQKHPTTTTKQKRKQKNCKERFYKAHHETEKQGE